MRWGCYAGTQYSVMYIKGNFTCKASAAKTWDKRIKKAIIGKYAPFHCSDVQLQIVIINVDQMLPCHIQEGILFPKT